MDDKELKATQKKLKTSELQNAMHSFIKENLTIEVEEGCMEGYNDKTKRFAVKLILDGETISETSILL